jgi:hypothetical protein
VLPASDMAEPAPGRQTSFRPTVINGARPALDLEQMTAVMEALEDYAAASLIAFEGLDPPAQVSEEALALRLASL